MMRKQYVIISIILSGLLSAGLVVLSAGTAVKEPSVAGSFYPADPGILSAMVGTFLSRVQPADRNGDLIALIAPHAGYEYSGAVAAHAYDQLKGRDIETVILIGPSHHAPLTGASVYTGGKLRTPLGDVPIDARLARSLINEKANTAFVPEAFDREHSLEVQLPFLQTVLKDFKVVPILIGVPTQEMFRHLAASIATAVRKNRNIVLVASSDLSHYHDYKTAETMDRRVINAVARMSLEELQNDFSAGSGEMCGAFPVLLTMAVSRTLGATHGTLLKYANSGDVTGDRSRVVGYAAIGLFRGNLNENERKELLGLAGKTINEYIRSGRTGQYRTTDPRLLANGAAFVTINRNGNLRGCIGNIEPVMPLYRSVITNAVSASTRDPRFPPMTAQELKDMQIEVTVLSPLEPLDDIRNIRIGKHGLYIINGRNAGILLPQVAEEYHWDVKTFLEEVSHKAGLPADAWKESQLYSFTADIIR